MAEKLRRYLPARVAYKLARWRNILLSMFLFKLARKRPEQTKQRIMGAIQKYLGPDYDVATHFSPKLQAVGPAAVPGAGRRSVPRHQVREGGDRHRPDRRASPRAALRWLRDATLAADIVVTATGLRLQLLGGMRSRSMASRSISAQTLLSRADV